MRKRKSYYGIELRVVAGSASRHHPGHEDRVADHQERIQAELTRMRTFCQSTGVYRQLSSKRATA